jgi:1,4-alpha-glucan branching enzyme
MGGKWSSMDPSEIEIVNIEKLLNRDPYLKPYENEIKKR